LRLPEDSRVFELVLSDFLFGMPHNGGNIQDQGNSSVAHDGCAGNYFDVAKCFANRLDDSLVRT
jgi:hypothetical protein